MLSFLFPLFLSLSMFHYLTLTPLNFSSSFSLYCLIIDPYSLFLLFILVLVIFTSFIASPSSDHLIIVLFSLFVPCFIVFCVDRYLLLYLSYEASIIPIFYIIVKWGSYPDRSLRAIMLLIYTSVFSLPFLYLLYYIYTFNRTFSPCLTLFSNIFPEHFLCIICVFIVFAVKLPIYGFHFWLPIAHVEAPTFGSMILAGVLLKLGGLGLIRFSSLVNFPYLCYYVLSYLLVFLVFSTLVCCFQSDFKRLVAYSSVSHIITIPFLILTASKISFRCVILLIFFHALRSPLLFMLVGAIYSIYSTRQLALLRGLALILPLLAFIIVLAFFFTLSAPPFPSFISEVLFFLSSYSLTPYFVVSLILFAFFSLVYNLNWLTTILFLSPLPTQNSFNLSFSVVLISFIYISLSGVSLLLLSCF